MKKDELGGMPPPGEVPERERGGHVIQMLGLAILTLGVALLDAQSSRQAPDAAEFVLGWLESIYLLLPFASAILVGILYRMPISRLFLMGLLVTVTMVGLDLLPASGAARAAGPPGLSVSETGELSEEPSVRTNLGGAGSIGFLRRYQAGEFDDAVRISTTIGDLPSRFVLTSVFNRLFLLLVPAWAMGMVVGAISWVDRRILFRDPRDEQVAYAIFAWLLGPGVIGASLWLTGRIEAGVVGGQSGFGVLLIPHLLFGALGVLGWWTRSRQER